MTRHAPHPSPSAALVAGNPWRDLLLEHVDAAVVIVDAAGRVRALNAAGRALGGAGAVDDPPWAAWPAAVRAQLGAAIEMARREGAAECRVQLADGHWLQARARRIPAPEPPGSAVVIAFTDVTSLVCDVEKASESAELYRSFVERAHAIAFRSGLDFRPYFFHGAVEELTGYHPEDFSLGQPRWDQIIHPDDLAARLAAGAELATGSVGAREFEYRVLRRDGAVRWVRESVHNICDPDGVPRWIQGSILDITERRLAEQALGEAQEHFRLAFATSPDAIAITRFADGRYLDVNEGWLALSGRLRAQVIGHTDLELGVWRHAEDRAVFAEALRRDGAVRNLELEFCHASGEAIPTLTSAALMTLGGRTCVLTQARDIRELKRAQRERRRLELKVLEAQKLESLGLLAAGVAHDFNNLLVGILGNLDLARHEPGLPPAVQRLLGDAERTAHQAAGLAGQMQALAGQGHAEVRTLDLGALVRQLVPLLESALARRARLELALPDAPLWVQGDPGQLQQVVLALVTNSAEAAPERGGTIRVEVHPADAGPGQVLLAVIDDGSGMSSEVRERLFEPFFSTKFVGRGLGLAAVRGIVHAHRGSIEVESVAGRGTTVRLRLPAAAGGAPASLAVAAAGADEAWRGQGRVLLVDDDAIVLEVGERMLRRMGFEVLLARDGAEALTLLRQHHRELCCVVLDQTMPELDGEATYRALREIDGALPVLIASGFSTRDLQARFTAGGALAFIQKPYRSAELGAALRALLEAHPGGTVLPPST